MMMLMVIHLVLFPVVVPTMMTIMSTWLDHVPIRRCYIRHHNLPSLSPKSPIGYGCCCNKEEADSVGISASCCAMIDWRNIRGAFCCPFYGTLSGAVCGALWSSILSCCLQCLLLYHRWYLRLPSRNIIIEENYHRVSQKFPFFLFFQLGDFSFVARWIQ